MIIKYYGFVEPGENWENFKLDAVSVGKKIDLW